MQAVQCLVISLKDSPRRPHVVNHLAEENIPFEFFDAKDGRNLSNEFASLQSFWTKHNIIRKRLLPGELGCFASHYSIWKRCASSNVPHLVFEDDIALNEHTAHVMSQLPGLVERLGFIRLHPTVHGKVAVGSHEGIEIHQCYAPKDATLAYCLCPAAAKNLVANCNSWSAPLDHYVASTYRHGVDIYELSPCIARSQEEFESSVQPSKRVRVPLWMRPFVKPIHGINKRWEDYQFAKQGKSVLRHATSRSAS